MNPAIKIVNGKQELYLSPEDWWEVLKSEEFTLSYFDPASKVRPEAMYFRDFRIYFTTGDTASIAKLVLIKCRSMEVSLEHASLKALFDAKDMINTKIRLLEEQGFKTYASAVREELVEAVPTAVEFLACLVSRAADANKLSMLEYFEYYGNAAQLFSKFRAKKAGDNCECASQVV